MRTRILLVIVLAAALGAAALVRRPSERDPFDREIVGALLRRPVDDVNLSEAERASPPASLLAALLAHPAATRTADGVTLRLGRVLADPTFARAAALAAGELLALEAVGPDGPLGKPLWRAILDGPVLQTEDGVRTLRLYGARHSADADAGPALEDTYHARLALAAALRTHAASEPGATPLVLRGEETPVKGGVNFEVQLVGTRQTLTVTFDGHRDAPLLYATRDFARTDSPYDARARASLVAALVAGATELEPPVALVIDGKEAAVAGGVDLRLEDFGSRVALVASGSERRLSSFVERESCPQPECE
jgi:hypothetical protein